MFITGRPLIKVGEGGGKQLQCKFARLDASNLSSPTVICADCCDFVLVHE